MDWLKKKGGGCSRIGKNFNPPAFRVTEVETKHEKKTYIFQQQEIDEIVEARYEELFEAVSKELKKAGRAGKLPSGVVLVGPILSLTNM